MTKDSFTELTLEELQNRLSTIEDDKQALQKALDVRRQQGKKDFVQEIKETAQARNYDLNEIVEMLAPKKRGSGLPRQTSSAYIRYVDPNNPSNVYVRGVLPRWMKDQMAANGLNAKNKSEREIFKEKYLIRTEA